MTLSDEDPYIEIAKLRSANKQAAEYGLALLNEKNLLEIQHEELENQHELIKLELEQLKNQLRTVQVNKLEEILKDEINEENFLNEKQTREEYLIKKIKSYEHELRLLKQDNERLNIENKSILFNSQQLTERIQEFDELKIKLKYDLKESKIQEQKLIDTNTELEEENVLLQQQVERLRKNLIDYDGLKVENQQLQENIDDLHRMIKELESLKAIAESQFIELHDNLRDERKQKHIYKQQLDNQIQNESLRNLNSLRMTLDGTNTHSSDNYLNNCNDDDDDDTSGVPSSIDYSDIFENDQQLNGNLFSEIHVNEIHKLELEYFQLSQIKSSLDHQLLTIHEKTKIVSHKIQDIIEKLFPNQISSNQFNSDDTNHLLMTSIDSIEQIHIFINKNLHLFNGEQEHTIVKLKQDLNIMMKQCNDTQIIFIKTHNNLMNLSEELENIHSYIFISNGLSIPSNDIQIKKRQLLNSNNKIIDLTINEHILNIIQEQIQQLKQSFIKVLDNIKQKEESLTNDLSNDTKELQDQLIKQRLLSITKREQISTLRKLLKENKQTAEIALANLKSKYENEKLILTENMSKLRSELKSLKEDTALFTSSHTTFAARCDEYITQLNQSQRQIHADEEEKQTLNSLLRMAIEQKFALTQKLERLEIDNQRLNNSTNLSRRTINSRLPFEFITRNSNQNIINNNLIPERGRFIPPRMMQAFAANRNQQLQNKR